jgi:hypothetical protein
MARAPTRRQDATLVKLCGNGPHAGEPLCPQVIHDGRTPRARDQNDSVASRGFSFSRPVTRADQPAPAWDTGSIAVR